MKYIEVDTYEKLCDIASELIKYEIKKNPNLVLGLATGSSPLGVYRHLIDAYKNDEISFSNIKTFNLDEYYGLDENNDQSYKYFMNKNLFSCIDIKKENINFLDGTAKNIQVECERYNSLLEKMNIDIQILGIGVNGHIAFNEPDVVFSKETHLVKLSQETIDSNSRFFDNKSLVPTTALTMGIKNIFKAKKIILIANGENKKTAIQKLLHEEITPLLPASILQLHNDCTIIYSKK